MRRLLRICLDTLLMSLFPILTWFILSIIVDERLLNMFVITYPIQTIPVILKSIFGTGANVSTYKDGLKNQQSSGIFWGISIGMIIFLFISLNIDSYLSFMNVDAAFYHEFALYSVLQIYMQYILLLVLEKLYYEQKNKLANKYSIFFNLINFFVLVGSILITKNISISIFITLIMLFIFSIFVTIKNISNISLNFKLIKCIKYDSAKLAGNLLFMFTYLIGFSNSFVFGEEYMYAISFFTLITDIQWDVFYSINSVNKVDISQKKFNYKYNTNNALKLMAMLNFSTIIMFIVLYPFYQPNLLITLIFVIPNMIDLIVYIFASSKKDYLQIEHSPIGVTVFALITGALRLLCSFFPTPYCTMIGQEVSIYLSFFLNSILFKKHYCIKEGKIIKKLVYNKIKTVN